MIRFSLLSRCVAGALCGATLMLAPALAQDKTKGADKGPPASLPVLDMCAEFIAGDLAAGAENAAIMGWMVNEEPSETPYSTTYTGFKSFAEVGDGNLWVRADRYPGAISTLCRVDMDMAGPDADAQVEALNDLDWLDGELKRDDSGIYGSWSSNGDNPDLVLALQGVDGFSLQMSSLHYNDEAAMP